MVRRASSYLPIAEHGLIGDLHSVALVGTDGTIDWYCCPRFDSPSVFASILDARRGGCYRLAPADEGWTSKQLYFPDTNVLITRFLTPDGVGEVEDFMPVAQTATGSIASAWYDGSWLCAARCASSWSARRALTTPAPSTRSSAICTVCCSAHAGCALALETETPLADLRRGGAGLVHPLARGERNVRPRARAR